MAEPTRVKPSQRRTRAKSSTDESALVDALRHGDESTFRRVVQTHYPSMLRVARSFVRNDEIAREVVQETWTAVVNGLDAFRQEASFRTWLFRILANKARRTATREGRTVAFSAAGGADDEGPAEATDRFRPDGHWASPVHGWESIDPESRAISRQGVAILAAGLDTLPPAQRAVVTMRDVEGLESEDICRALDISPGNQRVLLHRGRTRLREFLERAEEKARTARESGNDAHV